MSNSNSNTTVIESLTEEQEKRIPEFKDKWLGIGLSTNRINKDIIPEKVSKLYTSCGFKAPSFIMFGKNPHECCLQIALLEKIDDADVDRIRNKYTA